MTDTSIVVRGAREHNLQNIKLELPQNQLICLTGVSGSGKSSLAFDTLYAEGQRRYIESLSSFARQFLGQMPKPEVDMISGLRPTISISQKSTGNNPRSTVGTITEIYDYLRVLYARIGQGHCPDCGRQLTSQTRDQILEQILGLPEETKVQILAPVVQNQKGEFKDLFIDLQKEGFARVRVDGEISTLQDVPPLDRQMRHQIEVVIDRLKIRKKVRGRLAEAVELALATGKGKLIALVDSASKIAAKSNINIQEITQEEELFFSEDYACVYCSHSFETPEPQLFSFNSPHGMCQECDGLGELFSFDPDLLIPDEELPFKDGAFEILGKWKDMGRWRRHIYQGVADTIERKQAIPSGTMLETPWGMLSDELKKIWLWGTGKANITFTWRGGNSPIKYGGTFSGIIGQFLEKYRETKSKPKLRQYEKYMRRQSCPHCEGKRLNPQACFVTITSLDEEGGMCQTLSLPEACQLSVKEAADFFAKVQLSKTEEVIAEEPLKEICGRLNFLKDVGLEYLSLERTAPTLSGGEAQRIRLASQIGCGLVGVLYILDEPSIGLHARDNQRLIGTLKTLRDMGNTVVVVEHDEETMNAADYLVDFGPGPGVRGGEIVAQGSPQEFLKSRRSLTAKFLSGKEKVKRTFQEREFNGKQLQIRGARHNNLKGIDVDIPLGVFVCVTGVSGSGKSSLVNDIIKEALHRDLNRGEGNPGEYVELLGQEHLDKLIAIDQSPIGRTPRSNPVTYIKVWDEIRKLYASLPDAKRRGYQPGRFSFNVSGGRCEACSGNGSNRLEMDFLADIWVTCPVCEGHRFNRETLQVRFKDHSIADVLELDIQQAMELFENIPKIYDKLKTLHDVGLDYLKLGQPSPTLSGGEAQRIKLARELSKRSTGKTLYVLDEPTTGLHFHDIQLLLNLLHSLVEKGNTVLVIEHNLDVIRNSDWIIDIGPEGGDAGGEVIATGAPRELAKKRGTPTADLLNDYYHGNALSKKEKEATLPADEFVGKNKEFIEVRQAEQHNLKKIDVRVPRDQMSVFCGPSGSGKTSLAMDTIYAEGQRRYVESLSSYARQFVGQMQKPKLEHIEGLSPAIAIEQKNLGHTPRSTVGTVTEIYDYFRILMARLGTPYCPECEVPVGTQTTDQIVDKLLAEPEGTKLLLLAPVELENIQEAEHLWEELEGNGFLRVLLNGKLYTLSESKPSFDRRKKNDLFVVVDRLTINPGGQSRITESTELGLAIGKGVIKVLYWEANVPETKWRSVTHSQHLACHDCGQSFQRLTPHNFSFNSTLGWCSACEGLGKQVGTNLSALLNSPKLSLAEGAIALWPNLASRTAQMMLLALAKGWDLPLGQPFDQLRPDKRRLLLQGNDRSKHRSKPGHQWLSITEAEEEAAKKIWKESGQLNKKELAKWEKERHKSGKKTIFQFQFKGLYVALEEASRVNPGFRRKLEPFVDEVDCSACAGTRLREDAAAVRLQGKTIGEIVQMPLAEAYTLVKKWKWDRQQKKVAGEVIREIQSRLQFLIDVGLHYVTLSREAKTLSNGESQRIRLASQLGSGLCGVLYVLDEPTIGLHPRDNGRLLKALHRLRDLGNTLLVVEHDKDVIASSDAIYDFGSAAGKHGGKIVANGTPKGVSRQPNSVTGPYLHGTKGIPIPTQRRMPSNSVISGKKGKKRQTLKEKGKTTRKRESEARKNSPLLSPEAISWIRIEGARENNLKGIDVQIPLGVLSCVTGVSGSGKSSLVNKVLYNFLARTLHRASTIPGSCEQITGVEHINKVIQVDQQPIGNSPSSNPATYTGIFEQIRNLFAMLPEAKLRGYSARRFSFNVPGGRCEACEGNGQKCIKMHFMPDVWVECDVCDGKRYNQETLGVKYQGYAISDVLEMTCQESLELFATIPKIRKGLQTLCDVGLGYLSLGQPAPTLSGGESQRVKLAAELARPDTGRTLYILDEPTTGLHFDDLAKLLEVLQRLVDLGNSVLLIEHNLDVIKVSDWLIEMGPEGGDSGGQVLYCGTPEDLVANEKVQAKRSAKKKEFVFSHTAKALLPVLEGSQSQTRATYSRAKAIEEEEAESTELQELQDNFQMPWEEDGHKWHTEGRLDRKGQPCRWDGQILEKVLEKIHSYGDFPETNYSNKTVVEVTSHRKSAGWFFHAITAETWLIKMKFRVAAGTFKQASLLKRLPLTSLNEMDDLPIYGNESRVSCKQLGRWQELQIKAHTFEELDRPEFYVILEEAVDGFYREVDRADQNPDAIMPWKTKGQLWHLSRKGFMPRRTIRWKSVVLERLLEIFDDVAPEAQILWNNKILIHLYLPQQKTPWATVITKKNEYLELILNGPKNVFTYGQLTNFGHEREFDTLGKETDTIKLRFQMEDDLYLGDFPAFLKQHYQALTA
ncbi:MAG: excinuclease ABC subunit UvrA [Pirellulaceae bacterium]|nr:excinuclease ABC subunit UvrA [Pirellulaceae bacterium]